MLTEAKGKLKENFYILPSSINEVIIVPESYAEPDFIRTMVREVNTVVDKTKRLSNNIYFYYGYISTI